MFHSPLSVAGNTVTFESILGGIKGEKAFLRQHPFSTDFRGKVRRIFGGHVPGGIRICVYK